MRSIFAECFGSLEIEMFATEHEAWLNKHIGLGVGIPSHDTINRVMSILNPKHFTDCFLSWIKEIKLLLGEDVVAIDDKTLWAHTGVNCNLTNTPRKA